MSPPNAPAPSAPAPNIPTMLIDQFFQVLFPASTAFRCKYAPAAAQNIINIVYNRTMYHYLALPPGLSDDTRLQHFIDDSYTVLQEINSTQLAIDTGIKKDATDCITSVIRVMLRIFLGPYDVYPHRAVQFTARLGSPMVSASDCSKDVATLDRRPS